jgi:hypothetical protein
MFPARLLSPVRLSGYGPELIKEVVMTAALKRRIPGILFGANLFFWAAEAAVVTQTRMARPPSQP